MESYRSALQLHQLRKNGNSSAIWGAWFPQEAAVGENLPLTERMTRPPQGREVVDSVAKAFDADLVAQCTYQPRIKSVYDPDKLTSNLCRHYFNRMTGRSKIGLDTSPRHETRRSPIPTMAYAIQILHLSELFYRRY